MERLFIVYCHTNKINGKKYIGITSQSTKTRWGIRGTHYKSQTFGKAIEKYGWDNFEHMILADELSESAAKELEKQFIAEFHTTDPEYGYNITLGGEGCLLYATEEERLQARQETHIKTIAKRNADPVRREKYLEQLRELKAARRADPQKHQKDLEANRLAHVKQRSTVDGKAKDAAARKQLKADIKELRLKLIQLYKDNPALFTEEDYHIIFDRRQTPNKS